MYKEINTLDLKGDHIQRNIDSLPDECPICHYKISPKTLKATLTTAEYMEVFFQCTNSFCKSTFIGYYSKTYLMSDNLYLVGTAPVKYKEHAFPDEVKELSPQFVKIYNQALASESHGLDELVGIGLRKALEFLVKDYLVKLNPEKETDIKKKFLSNCIRDDIDDPLIKKCAERATWLGNDETHYEKKHVGKDLSDLKKLVQLTVNWIHNSILAEHYEETMEAVK